MVGDTVVTGSDDWTARMWSVSRGTCDAVLACHAGPILSVEYSTPDKGIITGWHSYSICYVIFPRFLPRFLVAMLLHMRQ